MRMLIEAYDGSSPCPELCVKAAKHSIDILVEIAAARKELKAPHSTFLKPPRSQIPFKMWEATHVVGDPDLTPMAAVAGATADGAADYLQELGVSKVIVNNGGDIAIRLAEGERVGVGIRSDVNSNRIERSMLVEWNSGIGGICTSGMGGRSFTRGIASAVTVSARSAAVADAAASAIANSTFIAHANIVREPAEKVDPDTDLVGIHVTYEVGKLPEEFVQMCLQKGLARAEALAETGIITGAVITIKGRTALSDQVKHLISNFG
jgi:uncharacterized protein